MMKKTMWILLVAALAGSLNAQLLTDNFDYTAGQLTTVSSGNWVSFSGTGYYIQVVDSSLAYSGYPASDIGRRIEVSSPSASAEDIYTQFTTQTVATYASCLIKIKDNTGLAPDTSTNGDYFIALLPSNSTTAYVARLCIKSGSAGGTFRLGIRVNGNTANTAVWHNTDLSIDGTHLVVLSYGCFAGTTNDTAALWVDPTVPGAEPNPDVLQGAAGGTDADSIGRFAIRQGYVTLGSVTTPNAYIDGIMVGSDWASVTGICGQAPTEAKPAFCLMPCSPNPVKSDAKFSFSLSRSGNVELSVFNLTGQKVATLAKGPMGAGTHSVAWQAGNAPNGIYFYQLLVDGRASTKKMVVIK